MDATQLSEPSEELRARVLGRVGFADRFAVAIVHEHTGPMPMTAYGFEQLANLLKVPGARPHFGELQRWVREVVEDEELAGRIAEAMEQGDSDLARAGPIRDLMQERLRQCQEMCEEEPNEETG